MVGRHELLRILSDTLHLVLLAVLLQVGHLQSGDLRQIPNGLLIVLNSILAD